MTYIIYRPFPTLFVFRIVIFTVLFTTYSCNSPSKKDQESAPTESDLVEGSRAVNLVLEAQAQLGEGAYWDHKRQQFYWVDILGKKVNSFDPVTGENTAWDTPSRVGTVVPSNDGKLAIALEDGIYLLDTEDGALQQLSEIESDKPGNRFNDGKCDPLGNLWVGSMHLEETQPQGALYKVQADGTARVMRDSVTISNGIVWTSDGRTMYYIDTPTAVIRAYDFDPETAGISDERVAVKVPDTLGFPDGMAIDAEDKLWVGMWNGNAVVRFDPVSGEMIDRIEVPAHNVTACAFGGPRLDTLYITTARVDMTPEELEQYPLAGSVFKVVPGVKGVPSAQFGQLDE